MISRALFFDGPRRVAIRDVEITGDDVARGIASAISQGTELLLYRGEGPTPFDPSLARMTTTTTTTTATTATTATPTATTYPCRYGYAWVGEHEHGDRKQRVFALAPHGDAHLVGSHAMRPIRSDIPATRATLAANLETAITCVWDAEAAFGERAVVLGAGLVGILVAWLLVRGGARSVTLVDPRAGRLACAKTLVPSLLCVEAGKADGSADVIIEATGDPHAIDDAIAWAAPSARIIVASFYGRRRAPVDLGDAFHRRRLSLVASQVSSIPPRHSGRWTLERRFDLVQDLLGEPNLDALIAPPVAFEAAPDLYARLARGDADADADADALPCHVLAYGFSVK
jgi:threonine dehydrogenase-like Zn-dependent dehydrogenase